MEAEYTLQPQNPEAYMTVPKTLLASTKSTTPPLLLHVTMSHLVVPHAAPHPLKAPRCLLNQLPAAYCNNPVGRGGGHCLIESW